MKKPVKRLSKRAIATRRKDVRWQGRQLDLKYAPRMVSLLLKLEEPGAHLLPRIRRALRSLRITAPRGELT